MPSHSVSYQFGAKAKKEKSNKKERKKIKIYNIKNNNILVLVNILYINTHAYARTKENTYILFWMF